MKKIVKPAQSAETEVYSDFSGTRFDHDIPEVSLKFDFNYGSKFDDSSIEFHFTEEESKEILELIKSKLSQQRKDQMMERLMKANANYELCMDSRDWDGCDYYGSDVFLCKYFLDKEDGDGQD
jgi:hypothetical protein